MLITKELFGKTSGRQYTHFVQSFDERDDITPELSNKIGQEYIGSLEKWRNFQVLMAVHTDQDHMHIHYIINSVNSKDGSKQDLKHFRERSDKLCRKYNLHVIEHGNRCHKSYGEYNVNKNGISWKAMLVTDIQKCLEQSNSCTDFLYRLNDCGVDADFGKISMLFTVTMGTYGIKHEMKCGDKKLLMYGNFSQSAIETVLSTNQNIIERAYNNPSVLMDAMYDVGQIFGIAHEDLLDRFYDKDLGVLT